MLKILHKDYKDKVKRLLSVMLPIIGTQIAIMGMNFFDASMSGQAGDADLAGAAIGGRTAARLCQDRPYTKAQCDKPPAPGPCPAKTAAER